MKTVVGLFESTSDAARMLEDLMQMGFQPDDISIVTSLGSQSKVEAGAVHLDPMNLVDVGKIAAGGPLRESLRRTAGLPLRGALERSGFPAELADRYAAGVERGGTLESLVVPDSEADRVVAAMKRRSAGQGEERRATEPAGPASPQPSATQEALASAEASSGQTATEPSTNSTIPRPDGDARQETIASRGLEADEEWRIPVVREELRVGKREVPRGTVRISVRATESPVAQEIHLRETHVDIERRAVDRTPSEDIGTFKDQVIEIAEVAEESVVSKQARVVEEVVVHKHVSERVETIRDSLRATQVDHGKVGSLETEPSRR